MPFSTLETPIPLVDLDRVERNLDRVAQYAGTHGLALRPHVKTHKSTRMAGEQLRRGASGLTCATPREAEVMSAVTRDLMLAYPPIGATRAARIAAVAEMSTLRIMLDSVEAIESLAAALHGSAARVGVLIELDLGMHRVGVASAMEALNLARAIGSHPYLEYLGIAFYPGHIRGPVNEQASEIIALNESLGAVIDVLTAEGYPPTVVSGGSTPTLFHSHLVKHLTEIRPGTSIYNDRTTAAIGACSLDDCALTVLATVVSTAVPNQGIIDAGTKALGREPIRGSDAPGYGVVLGREEIIVTALSEEHGTLDLSKTEWQPSIGDQVRIIPNHVCIVTHLFDEAVGIRGEQVEERWQVEARGR